MWQIRKNCSLFITSGTLSQFTGNTSICNTSKINFRRLEALSCGVWPSPEFSLLSSRISLQNRKNADLNPLSKKARPARLSGRKSLISSDFRRVRGLLKRPQNGHPRHSCIKRLEIELSARARGFESHPLRQEVLEAQCFKDFYFSRRFLNSHRQQQNGAHGAKVCGAPPANKIFGIFLPWCPNGARHLKSGL